MNGGPGAASGSPSEAPGGTGMPEQGTGTGTAHQRRWPLVSSLEFGALATAVPCARLHTHTVLYEWGIGELADDAELIVSELATNALTASQSLPETQPFTLCLRSDYTRLIIEVWTTPARTAFSAGGRRRRRRPGAARRRGPVSTVGIPADRLRNQSCVGRAHHPKRVSADMADDR